MLRIESDPDGRAIKLSGRITSDLVTEIRAAMDRARAGKRTLDLAEVTLVDMSVVCFLIRCENEGVTLLNCPAYVREWMHRERCEGGHLGNPNAG